MNLGLLTDGLLCLYKIYCKRCKSEAFKENLAKLKTELITIYENLPGELKAYYRRRKLALQEKRIEEFSGETIEVWRDNLRSTMGVAAELHRKMVKMREHRQAIFELSLLFGINMELSKYFFRKLAKLEDDLYIVEIISPSGKRQLWPLLRESIVLGRRDSVAKNLLVVEDRYISKPHSRITRETNRVTIEDLNSRNGTLVNGATIRGKISITPKDKIAIGNTCLFCYSLKREHIIDTLETQIAEIKPSKSQFRLPLIITAIALFTALLFTFWPTDSKAAKKNRMAKQKTEERESKAILQNTDSKNQYPDDGLVEYQGERITPEEKYTREQVGKGLVKYQGEWLTLQQKYEKQQLAKGLVKYQNQWLLPKEKYKREQLDKGMIQYQGKWLTPEEKSVKEQIANGQVNYRGQWCSPEQRGKKARRYVEEQLRDLRKNCKQAAKKEKINDAYQVILAAKNAQFLEDLQYAAKAQNPRRCYVFPASLYRESENFSALIKLPHLQKEITSMEIHFAGIIEERIALKNRRQISIERQGTLRLEIANIEDKLAMPGKLQQQVAKIAEQVREAQQRLQRRREKIHEIEKQGEKLTRDLQKNRQQRNNLERNADIAYLKRKLGNRESDLNRQRERTREIQQDILDARRDMEQENNPEKKSLLQQRIADLQRQKNRSLNFEKTIHDESLSIYNRIDKAQQKITAIDSAHQYLQNDWDDVQRKLASKKKLQKQLEETTAALKEKITTKQATIEDIRKQWPKFEARIREIRDSIKTLKELEHKLDAKIAQLDETLSPLDRLYAKRKSITKAIVKYQKWWSHIERNKKSFADGKYKVKHYRANTLLALFILKYFPVNSYRVKTDESFRNFAGIVWIYY